AMAKVVLAPGEKRRVRLTLRAEDCAYLDARLEPRLEPGKIEIHVGPSARPEALLTAKVDLVA
ncbi:MAG: fibronectin type III-like domain-contianing protein, partial [Rhodospirillaceae bacterium]|nr:fibronectin type III-like domain-contianing protein [Rhodospirillaceae bacterium]